MYLLECESFFGGWFLCVSVCLFVFGTGDQTKDLALARQVSAPLSYIPRPVYVCLLLDTEPAGSYSWSVSEHICSTTELRPQLPGPHWDLLYLVLFCLETGSHYVAQPRLKPLGSRVSCVSFPSS